MSGGDNVFEYCLHAELATERMTLPGVRCKVPEPHGGLDTALL